MVTLVTDFGLADHYVGALKGAILSCFPQARMVDVSHSIGTHEIAEGAYILSCAYSHFPRGTVHIAIVDPGVGGYRRAIAVQTERAWFVGPDNGVLSWALELEGTYTAREVHTPPGRHASPTFHGRDVFAPAGAQLAEGEPFETIGPEIDGLVKLERHVEEARSGMWRTKVVHVDRFGNLICGLRSNDSGVDLGRPSIDSAEVLVAGRVVRGLKATYSDVPEGELLALFSSSGHLEIAVSRGSASSRVGVGVGADVTLRLG